MQVTRDTVESSVESSVGAGNGVVLRRVAQIVPAVATPEGGFIANRPFPSAAADWFDPFLLLDDVGPINVPAGTPAGGVPPHPHRGIETVTYIVSGEVEHRDSAGHHGVIGAGDVQWMTAGDGIIHSEMASARLQAEGGISHGLQLWVNLPAAHRRTTPRYQALRSGDIAVASGDGWTADVVAGSMLGVDGPASTHTPITYARVTVESGTELAIPAVDGHTALVYAFAGAGGVGGERLAAGNLAVLDRNGTIVLDVPADAPGPLDCLVITGEPINEPMVRSGPFVMNTAAELDEAFADFRAGRMGSITATGDA